MHIYIDYQADFPKWVVIVSMSFGIKLHFNYHLNSLGKSISKVNFIQKFVQIDRVELSTEIIKKTLKLHQVYTQLNTKILI